MNFLDDTKEMFNILYYTSVNDSGSHFFIPAANLRRNFIIICMEQSSYIILIQRFEMG